MNKHVVVLGAGFSRAVSAAMPLTDQVGRASVDLLAGRGYQFGTSSPTFSPQFNFENWLSLLSEDQPQLREAENRDNAALSAHLRGAIADILSAAQLEVLGKPAPDWLYKFVNGLHRERATVLTLNYDSLVEAAVDSQAIWDERHKHRVSSADIMRNLPPKPNVGVRFGHSPSTTFRLLKLHGSLDWWAVPGDSSGATLNREDIVRTFEHAYEMSAEQRERELPGRERSIIPPLSTKSAYYRNPLTRELWQQAHQALREAARISIIGYSLPATDLVMSSMLQAGLSGRDVMVDVVNPDGELLAARLIELSGSGVEVNVKADNSCVAQFARTICEELSATLAKDLRQSMLAETPQASLIVAWGAPEANGPSVRRVTKLASSGDGTLELILEDPPHRLATDVRRGSNNEPADRGFPTAADVAQAVKTSRRLIARTPKAEHLLLSAWHEGRNTGANSDWIVFAPADRQPTSHESTG